MGQRKRLEEFKFFSQLPSEIRVKIWRSSFEPRVLELHSSRAHYAVRKPSLWFSRCVNPVTLFVCTESRTEALSFYTVALPLGDECGISLYVSPAVDTLVALGEVDYHQTHALLSLIASLDPTGQGLQRFGLSFACWTYTFAGATLRACSKTIFKSLEQFVLVMYTDFLPPADFKGGSCYLEDCERTDQFTQFVREWGTEFKNGNEWMTVGRSEMQIMNLGFFHRN
ncbi:hypothetical protein BKA67DRAFT_576614 [Truncatella angustata]|uniref:2EXR domain-containing protein n=1 Tax=Truncatella angustata TaxID=152316 RepID=A0A9P8UFP3_9PEZI|nr:uncharacterized protein BKA67DRAFT_576614 [Truncatella angustata]KAH6649039.1 hypothetical protein BKA67DRAFT_576614 [Truncatella angustata]